MIGGLVAQHTLGRRRPVMVPDGRGGEQETWPNPADPAALPGWALDAGNTIEDTTNRDGSQVTWTARGPYTADVHRHDRIIVFGEEYEIDGDVRRQPGASDLTSHTILLLKRWVG